MTVMDLRASACVALAATLLTTGAAFAADPLPEEEVPVASSDWVVQVTPYMWAAGMRGDISPFRAAPTIHVEKSFGDVMEDFNMGGFLNIWARRDDIVFSGDMMYVNTSSAKSTRVLPDLFPGGLEVSGELDSIEFNATAQIGYRLVDTPDFTFDALAGGRYWCISNEVTIRTDLLGSISRKEQFNWIDPVIGARAFYNITDQFSLLAQADIGGFGAGSDLTWSVLGTLNYTINDHWTVSAGYKHLAVDYRKNDYVFDVNLSGPVLGVTYRFH